MSPHARILALSLCCLLPLGGCEKSRKTEEEHPPRNARDATVYIAIVARALAALPRIPRPGAPLGIHVSTYLSTRELPVHGARESITILSPLVRNLPEGSTPFTIIQTIGNLVRTDIVGMMNRSVERGEALNHYLSLLNASLQEAQKQKTILEGEGQSLKTKEREERDRIRALQKEVDTAKKTGDFQTVGARQNALSETKGEHGKTEASIDELKNTLAILGTLLRLAEERSSAIEKNREALIAGIHVVDIPGIDALGILEKDGKSPRTGKRRDHGGGLLDFSNI